MESLKKYTVITGASSGIGYAAAKIFAKRNKNIIVVARREERLEKLKAELTQDNNEIDVVIKICDLSALDNVFQLYDELKNFSIETLINNAGFGDYSSVASQDLSKILPLLRLNMEAMTILSTLYVKDYKDVEGTQLINISSAGGYVIVPNAVTYCASKFYVSAFTEGLAHELKAENAKMQVKVLAPAATETEFGMVANNIKSYNYKKGFKNYHTSEQMADFLIRLYDSNKTVGIVDREIFEFTLKDSLFQNAYGSDFNQSKEDI